MAQSIFGTGNLWGIPAGTNPTPVRFGTLQDVAVDFSFDFKMLYGGTQFPVEQARGKAKLDLKATLGRVDPVLFNGMFFGSSAATGEQLNSVDETTTIPGTPYIITVANGATFSRDLGVYDTTAKKFLTRVASAPATGQYAVNTTTGAYTYAAADTTHVVRASYTYGSTTTGTTITYTNTLMGAGPIFAVELVETYVGSAGSKSFSLYLPAVQSSKLTMPLKLDDFTMSSIDMSAQDDGAGNIFTMSITG